MVMGYNGKTDANTKYPPLNGQLSSALITIIYYNTNNIIQNDTEVHFQSKNEPNNHYRGIK